MALTYTFKTTANANGSSNTLTSSSFTPSDNSLLVVVCTGLLANGGAANFSITDSGSHTWTAIGYQKYTNVWSSAFGVFYTQISTGASMTVTVDFHATTTDANAGHYFDVIQFTGHDTTTPMKNAYQTGGTAGRSGSFSGTLSAAPASSSYVVTATANDSDGASASNLTPGSGWTQITEVDLTFLQALSQYRTGSTSTAVDMANFTTNGAYSWVIGGVEVVAASGGSPQTITGVKMTNSQSFGAAKLNLGLTGAKVTNSQSFKTAVLTMQAYITGQKVANTQSFKVANVQNLDHFITAVKVTNSQSFGTAKLNMNIVGVKLSNTQSFGADTIASSYTIVGSKYTNVQSFGVAKLALILFGAKITNIQSFKTAVIGSIAMIQGAKFTNIQSIGSATITLGPAPQAILATKVTNAQSFKAAVLTSVAAISAHLYTDPDTFFFATLTGGGSSAEEGIVSVIRHRRR